jgi:hypothetical protein
MYTRLTMWAEIDAEAAAEIAEWEHSWTTAPSFSKALYSASYYHQTSGTRLTYDDISKSHNLSVDASCKNYNGEIEAFLDWLEPHDTGQSPMAFRGFIQYEEDERPTLIFWDADAGRYTYEPPEVPK